MNCAPVLFHQLELREWQNRSPGNLRGFAIEPNLLVYNTLAITALAKPGIPDLTPYLRRL
jgi:hypothetical protein